MIDKFSYKILKYVIKNKNQVSYNILLHKFKKINNPDIKTILGDLQKAKYVYITYASQNSFGDTIDPEFVKISLAGIKTFHERRDAWYSKLIWSILSPILVAIVTTIITLYIKLKFF
jgi:hypothetical protein